MCVHVEHPVLVAECSLLLCYVYVDWPCAVGIVTQILGGPTEGEQQSFQQQDRALP